MSWLLLCSMAFAQDDDVLMVGNSYTARNGLDGVFAGQLADAVPGWPDPTTRSITTGGQTLAGHLRDADGTNGNTGLQDALVTGEDQWDTVILQDQSQIPGFYQDNGTWLASLDGAVGLNQLVEEHGADTALFLTWGRRSGDSDNPQLYPTFTAMQDRLTDGYLAYAAEAGTPQRPVTILPVGEAWRKIYNDAALDGDPEDPAGLFARLYDNDGSHPSAVGTALIGATFTAGLAGRTAVVSADLEAQGIDAQTQQSLIAAANSVTLEDPFGSWSFPWVHALADWQGAIDSDGARPLVWLDEAATLDSLTLGDGQLHILEDGVLTVDALSLTTESTLLIAGTLDVDEVLGDLHIPADGTLMLGDPQTTIEGSATLEGTLVMSHTLPEGGSTIVLSADALTLGDGVQLELPAGYSWEQVDNEIRVSAPGGGGCGCASTPAPQLPLIWLTAWCCLGFARRSSGPAPESAAP